LFSDLFITRKYLLGDVALEDILPKYPSLRGYVDALFGLIPEVFS
jgi:hypothetical protein